MDAVVESVCRDPKLRKTYATALQEQDIRSLDDLDGIDVDSIVSLGFKERHAKALKKKSGGVLLKICLHETRNVVGCIRTHQGTKIEELRKLIEADEIPVRTTKYQFSVDNDRVAMTSAQEETWDVFVLTKGKPSGEIIVMPSQKEEENNIHVIEDTEVPPISLRQSDDTFYSYYDDLDSYYDEPPFSGSPPGASTQSDPETTPLNVPKSLATWPPQQENFYPEENEEEEEEEEEEEFSYEKKTGDEEIESLTQQLSQDLGNSWNDSTTHEFPALPRRRTPSPTPQEFHHHHQSPCISAKIAPLPSRVDSKGRSKIQLWIANFDPTMTSEKLRQLAEQFGEVLGVQLHMKGQIPSRLNARKTPSMQH